MKEVQVTTAIIIKEDGEVITEVKQAAGAPDHEDKAAAGGTAQTELTEDEAQRYAVASDLANVCEYLEDSEVIKIRLIVSKAQARKERAEND